MSVESVASVGPNLVPSRYRGVAVARVDCPLDQASLREHFLGRDAYWKTRFLVVRRPGPAGDADRVGPMALLRVRRAGDDELFSPITAVELIAGPADCAYLHCPEVDTAIPSGLAAVAAKHAQGVRAVAVQGRYEHVNVIIDPQPLRVRVREVVPPRPAKLADQASRILDVAEDLPPIRLEYELVDLADLAREHPAAHYLLPCRGGGGEVPGARISYLDECPTPPEDGAWTLLGCERSRQIHRWFYGSTPAGAELCPKVDLAASGPGALLVKCCQQQEHTESGQVGGTTWASVPWGASLEHVREALTQLATLQEPTWSPV